MGNDHNTRDSKQDLLRLALLEKLRENGEREYAAQLDSCCQPVILRCSCCDKTLTVRSACKRRWCPVCSRRIAARNAARYRGLVAGMSWPLFATFTVKNYDDVEAGWVRHLRRSFGKLRRLRWWVRNVRGGVAAVEVTNIGNGWHPHLHAVIDARWLSVTVPPPRPGLTSDKLKAIIRRSASEVSEQWSLCCGRKGNVKVKRAYLADADGVQSITSEVLKYSVKGQDLVDFVGNPGDVIREMEATRMLTSFGSCYGHLAEHDPERRPMACEHCGEVGQYIPESEISALIRAGERSVRHRRRLITSA